MSSSVTSDDFRSIKLTWGSALLVWGWREKIIELLHAPVEADPASDDVPVVVEGAENVEEDFYAKSLKSQGQLQMYLTAYAAALMDRKGEFTHISDPDPESLPRQK